MTTGTDIAVSALASLGTVSMKFAPTVPWMITLRIIPKENCFSFAYTASLLPVLGETDSSALNL